MTRRGRGEDSIYRDGDRWRGAASLGYGADGRRVRKKVSGVTKAQVLQKLRELHTELDAGGGVPDDRLTVGGFLDRWVEKTLPGQMADKTYDSYADTVRLHLGPALGRTVLRRLSVAQVDEFLAWKRDAGYSENSIRIFRAVLRRALRQAEREGLVPRNVAALSTAPKIRSDEGRALSVAQARRLLDEVQGTDYAALLTITLAFGLRRGEALGLRWEGFDADGATLKVTHSVKRVRDHSGVGRRTRLVVGEVKTPRSRRTLFLTPELVELLRVQRVRLAEQRIGVGAAWQDFGLIFPSGVGTPRDPDNCRTRSRGLLAGPGWVTGMCMSRHSGASLMLAQGTDLYVVSEVLGHSSVAITKDVYGHLVEGQKRSAAALMSGALLRESGSLIGSQSGKCGDRTAEKPDGTGA